MYTGQVQVNNNSLESLLAAADTLSIVTLKTSLFSFMADSLNIDCAVLYWRLAEQYQQLDLVGQCRIRLQRDFSQLNFTLSLINASEEMMKEILSADNLELRSETEACETIMKWLLVQTERGTKIEPVRLLQVIRWSDVSVEYITSTLLNNDALIGDAASVSFLSKVLSYKTLDVEFQGLRTYHRTSSGLENCLVTVALSNGTSTCSSVCRISLQHKDRVTAITDIPTIMNSSSAACTINNTLYVTGAGCESKETWKLDGEGVWIRCTDMSIGRRMHCLAVVDTTLYVLGGWADDVQATLTSIKSYNSNTDNWTHAGELLNAVKSAACVTYNSCVYVFGGMNNNNIAVDCVQTYNPTDDTCLLLDTFIPCRHWMRAVLWEKSAIFLGRTACFIFNFESLVWEERRQFMAGVDNFALILSNATVFIAGGVDGSRSRDDQLLLKFTSKISCVSVLDIIEDKHPSWKIQSHLPKPAMIHSYSSISLSLGQDSIW